MSVSTIRQNPAINRFDAIRKDADVQLLMNLLAAYPLAKQIVLANLHKQSPQEIWLDWQAVNINLNKVSDYKNKTIFKCVEYPHKDLSADTQTLLLYLSPLKGLIDRNELVNYIRELQNLELLQKYSLKKIDDAIQEAVDWGLLKYDDILPHLIIIQPVFPYFLKKKLESLDEPIHQALEEAFKNHYLKYAEKYYQLLNSLHYQDREKGRLFCEWQYENLYKALQICLKNQESISIYFCLDRYLDLINDNQSNQKLTEMVCQHLEQYPSAFIKSELGYQIPLSIQKLGHCQLLKKQYSKARKSYTKALEIYSTLESQKQRKKQIWQASAYYNLGIIAQQMQEFAQAESNYQQALDIYIKYSDRYHQARTYYQLGNIAQQTWELSQAQEYYHQALQIYIEHGDRYFSARTYYNLGVIAQELREFAEAKGNYQQALQIYIEHSDRYSCASTYYNLGVVAEALQELSQAQRNYQQALDIYIEHGDRHHQALTYQNLASIAEQTQEFAAAQHHYQQALIIYIAQGDRYEQAKIYQDLASVAQKTQQFGEAQRYYQQALDIYIEQSDRYEQANIYQHLGLVAQQMQNLAQAQSYYQQALDIYIEYGDRYKQARTYQNLGLIAQNLQDAAQARHNYQRALDIFVEYGDRYSQAHIDRQLELLAQAA
ncbi:tetratricopeptide repeat protein [Calothrix sp. FACHB-156]|nr:tetratricopeptide repeat protein [Calothrix sp. FACHB-156]